MGGSCESGEPSRLQPASALVVTVT